MKRTFATLGTTLFVALAVLAIASPAAAAASSSNVVIIGGSTFNSYTSANFFGFTGGGMLPVDSGRVPGYAFTPMLVGSVTTSALDPYDTAVLNMATYDTQCNGAKLGSGPGSPAQALIDFVAAGHKLIIYDSECYPGPVDYSWLPYPFVTANPGARGAHGTLTIVEENTLSSNDPSSPYYINAAYLSSYTDAVGDMNVMTTYDTNWYVDMTGTNALGISGPVHTYARYGTIGSVGLVIYNGLDQDYQQYSGDSNLLKIWRFELAQPFNPDGLPGLVPAAGIALTPETASNPIGTTHVVTATVSDLFGGPVPDIPVTFLITNGPNQGLTSTVATDSNGQATFSWSSATDGTDTITASFIPPGKTTPVTDTATKQWTIVYGFAGFFPPVANPPVVNEIKAGQSVPVKWIVTLYGEPVSDPAHVVSLTAVTMPCDLGTTPDLPQEVAVPSLLYLGDGAWHFNWKVPKSYANSCKTLTLTLADGGTHTALFRIK